MDDIYNINKQTWKQYLAGKAPYNENIKKLNFLKMSQQSEEEKERIKMFFYKRYEL